MLSLLRKKLTKNAATCAVLLALTVSPMLFTACSMFDTQTSDRYMHMMRQAVTVGTNLALMKNPKAAPTVVQVTEALQRLLKSQPVMSVAVMPGMVHNSIKGMVIPDQYRAMVEMLFGMVVNEVHFVLVHYKVTEHEVVKYVLDVVDLVHSIAMDYPVTN